MADDENDDPVAAIQGAGDDDFDTLGFDTGFGMDPGMGLGDDDETPPGGIFVGEEVQVLDAGAIGRALAEAEGRTVELPPDLAPLRAGLVGIDVGAAAAVVARFTEDGQHDIVPNQNNELSTPVQVFFDDDGERLVGREARQMAASAPERAVVDLKRALTDPACHRDLGDVSVDGATAVETLVRQLLEDAEEYIGERPTHVALAAPTWFTEEHRTLLRQAAEACGVEVVGISDEALAAAVPYSLRLPDLNLRRALVFDCGHGALGVSVVRCAHGDIEVLAQASRPDLGSAQWDALIRNEAARKFRERFSTDPLEDPAAALDLTLRAEDAKKALSQRPQCTLVVQCDGKTLKVGFTRRGLEAAGKKLIEGARELLTEVRNEAGISEWTELHALILTGGGSRTPALRRMVVSETGLRPAPGASPEEAVAIGALYWGIGERYRRQQDAESAES